MKISRLIKELEYTKRTLGDVEVVMSKDAEGNGFSPCDGIEEGSYLIESTYSGEFYVEDPPEDVIKAICLWPVN